LVEGIFVNNRELTWHPLHLSPLSTTKHRQVPQDSRKYLVFLAYGGGNELVLAHSKTRNDHELQALVRQTAYELTRTPEGSADRRNAVATLENMATARRLRGQQP
jgi:hypothetical protein